MKLYEISEGLGTRYGLLAENYEEAIILVKELNFDEENTSVKEVKNGERVFVLFGDANEVIAWDFTNGLFDEEEMQNVKAMSAGELVSFFV